MVAALAADWDPSADGPTPDVWVPDSSAWVRKASVDAGRRADHAGPAAEPGPHADGDRDAASSWPRRPR